VGPAPKPALQASPRAASLRSSNGGGPNGRTRRFRTANAEIRGRIGPSNGVEGSRQKGRGAFLAHSN